MAKIKTLNQSQGNTKKKAIVPRGRHEAEIIKPRFDKEITIRELADQLLKEYAESDGIWLQDFFIKRLITRKQIMNMRTRSEYFSEIYSLCKDIQESRLFKAGITGAGNIQQVIFALKNVSLWRNEPSIETEATQPATIILKPHRDADVSTIEVVGFKFEVLKDTENQTQEIEQ